MAMFGLRRRRQEQRRQNALPTVVFPGTAGRPFPLLADLVLGYGRDAPAPPTLYLGDSAVFRTAHQDADQRPLGQMVQDALGGPDMVLWSAGSAHQPELWQDALRLFEARLPRRPATLLLPINLRMFSTQWSGNPLWALRAERRVLTSWQPSEMVPPIPDVVGDHALFAGFDRRLAGFNEPSRLGALRRLAASKDSGERQAADARFTRLLRWHYGEPLLPHHPRLLALADTFRIAAALGIRAVAYVTPVNVGAMSRLAGPDLPDRIRANIDVVRQSVPDTAPIADLHDLLAEDAFFHANLATEHLAQEGRQVLAARIRSLLSACRP